MTESVCVSAGRKQKNDWMIGSKSTACWKKDSSSGAVNGHSASVSGRFDSMRIDGTQHCTPIWWLPKDERHRPVRSIRLKKVLTGTELAEQLVSHWKRSELMVNSSRRLDIGSWEKSKNQMILNGQEARNDTQSLERGEAEGPCGKERGVNGTESQDSSTARELGIKYKIGRIELTIFRVGHLGSLSFDNPCGKLKTGHDSCLKE